MSDYSQYKYEEMSNKVVFSDKRFTNRAGSGATGDPESLKGRIKVSDLGSKVTREAPSSEVRSREVARARESRKKARTIKARSVLNSEIGSYNYVPSTEENAQVFGLIKAWVQQFMADVPEDVLRDATDEVIKYIKEDDVSDAKRKEHVEAELTTKVTDELFNQLVNLTKRITDYYDDDRHNDQEDEEIGVAVDYNDEEEEEENVDMEEEEEEESDFEFGADALSPVEEDVVNEEKEAAAENDINPEDISALWLQDKLSTVFLDAHDLQEKTHKVFELLESSLPLSEVENELMELFEYEHTDIVMLLGINRDKIVWATRYHRAESEDDKRDIEKAMIKNGHEDILKRILGVGADEAEADERDNKAASLQKMDIDLPDEKPRLKEVDLDAMTFEQGSHLMNVTRVNLPPGATTQKFKDYEEINAPAPAKPSHSDPLVSIHDEMPAWTHSAFPTTDKLNRVQSRVYPVAFKTDQNMLLCAPTGAGKTNVAMLTILQTLSKYRLENGQFDLDAFKIVYVSPLKALVQEQVREFSERLAPYGVQVSELTGDRNLTKRQLSDTQLIVTTPEKWDVITRKASDTSYTNLVRLIIIDEIHLLHDERGPVIESIVSRSLRQGDIYGEHIRLVGLSATLPNYIDVAKFLRVTEGLFYFDASYRPCPLAQRFIGVTVKKASKRRIAMNEICYTKMLEYAGQQQMLIFVHSRKETAATARFLRDKAMSDGNLEKLLPRDQASREVLNQEGENAQDANLRDLFPTAFGIHHAGLSRADRNASEQLFREGRIQVLVCTATLAWGVNLPAHTVIIKGTQVYSPVKGHWVELTPQDTLQMLGRAGRPQYDNYGEGIIITTQPEVRYYVSLMNAQLPIESHLMTKLADSLNAEVVLGGVRSIEDAVTWLGYTYLYVRMLKDPRLYKVGPEYADDPQLIRKRYDLAHTALMILSRSRLVQYNPENGQVRSTEVGRIASHFYISHTSMNTYNKQLTPWITPIDLLRIFATSEEFHLVPVRQEESVELTKLLEKAPIPIRESIDEPAAKINVLLQAYISRLKLDGFALMADMVYITQSAGRLLRAMFEICLRKGYAHATRMAFELCKIVENRLWLSNSPLRQFPNAPAEVIRKMETSRMPWSRYFDLRDPSEVGQAIRLERMGKVVYDMIHEFPRLDLKAQFQPINSEVMRIELEITPNFVWNYDVHGSAMTFLVLVEDGDGETILHSETFLLRQQYADQEHTIEFPVQILDPLPPNYFVSVISERWLHCEAKVAVPFHNLIEPKSRAVNTDVLSLQPAVVPKEYKALFNFDKFNQIQTQAYSTLTSSDANVFIGASVGNGKTECAKLALIRHWTVHKGENKKAIYVAPLQDVVDVKLKQLGVVQQIGMKVEKLTGELSSDLQILARNDLILATPQQWDVVSRRWQKRRHVQNVSLFIADDIQMIGALGGPAYETVVSRMRFMSGQLADNEDEESNGETVRIIGLGVSLADAKDVGRWLGCNDQGIFNFSPNVRMNSVEKVRMLSFNIPHHPSLMISMARPTYYGIVERNSTTVVFVPDRKQCIETGLDLVHLARGDGKENLFRLAEELPMLDNVEDETLKGLLESGVGYIYPGMSRGDRKLVELYFQRGMIQVLLAPREMCWTAPNAELVIIMGTQFFEGYEHRYIDYSVNEILQMMGHVTKGGDVMVMTTANKKWYYTKFLGEPLPIESHLNLSLHDAFIPEITEQVIESRQESVDWLTFTFFYNRLKANPSYYGLVDKSEEGISLFLSNLVESTLDELVENNMIELDEEEDSIAPQNGAIIAAYYSISFSTMHTFIQSLSSRVKMRGILEIVTSASEFDLIPIRNHEDKLLKKIYSRVPYKASEEEYNAPRFKAFILAQAHMARLTIPPDLVEDQKMVLQKIVQLLAACVDVLSGDGNLNAMRAMELSQLLVQALLPRDSPLKQIPFFDDEVVDRCKKNGVETVLDFNNMESEELREEILGFDESDERMGVIAEFTGTYPEIENITVEDVEGVVAGEPASMIVTIRRERDEEEEAEVIDTTVSSQFYPFSKTENWWLVVGDSESKTLYGIKRTPLNKPEQDVKLTFMIPTAATHKLTVWCVCDSYVDVDREVQVDVEVAPGGDDDVEMEE
ncbi:pre-mRNA-splicing helicase Brr2p [Trichomonascus vanleenenianus]|uniref:ATP-dependent RNA helicase BRR2 n=1 Tax=Trichomonascus vanleenenianus TaxID=2268995 RepID=UPI003ECB95E0